MSKQWISCEKDANLEERRRELHESLPEMSVRVIERENSERLELQLSTNLSGDEEDYVFFQMDFAHFLLRVGLAAGYKTKE